LFYHKDIASISNDTLKLAGWAADTRNGVPAKAVVIFINGKFVRATTVSDGRPDVAAGYKNPAIIQCGFSTAIPVGAIGKIDKSSSVTIFALSPLQLLASELRYPENYPFKH
jgi:hypothetical protein